MNKQTQDIRWQQRFDNLQAAYQQLKLAVTENKKQPNNQLIQMALVKAFEMTFELSWKTLQDYLKHQGLDTKTPRETIKQAFQSDLIENGELWIAMLDDRNLMTHTYNKERAALAIEHIAQHYLIGINQVYELLNLQITKSQVLTTNFGLSENILQMIIDCLRQYSEIRWAKIYGSRAKGNYHKGSDVDLVFSASKDISASLLSKLDEGATPYLFDVTYYETIDNLQLKDHIDRIGITIFAR